MNRLALFLALFSPPLRTLMTVLTAKSGVELLPYPQLALCVPAALIGLVRWRHQDGYRLVGIHWVVAAAAIGCLSLMWSQESERGRAAVILVGTFIGLPIGRLIAMEGLVSWSGKVFSLGCAVQLLTILLLTSDAGRLGQLALDDAGRISNANEFGGLMVAGIAVAVSFLMVGTNLTRSEPAGFIGSYGFVMGLIGFLSLGALLSGSRSALVCLALLSGVYMLGSREIVGRILLVMMLGVVVVGLVAADSDVMQTATERFRDTENVQSLGDRRQIWEAGWDIWQDHFFQGVGVGSVEKSLALYLVNYPGTKRGEDGVGRKAAHNGYLEWILSVGLLGIIPLLGAMLTLAVNSIRLDRLENGMRRQMLTLFCLVFCMTTTIFRLSYWVPLCALLCSLMTQKRLVASPVVKQQTPVFVTQPAVFVPRRVPSDSQRTPGRPWPPRGVTVDGK